MNNSKIIAFWSGACENDATVCAYAVWGMYAVRHPESRTAMLALSDEESLQSYIKYGLPSGKSGLDVLFLDCGSSRSDDCFMVLRKATMVVVALEQDERSLGRYVMEDERKIPEAMVLFGNYYARDGYLGLIMHKYRIGMERMGVLPANEEFAAACRRGRARTFIRKEQGMAHSERNAELVEELSDFTKKLECMIDQKMC